jgi:hypothetical protein
VDRRSSGNLETWQNWDVYHGIHHIGSSFLPSGLLKVLDPNFPPITKVTRFIVFLVLRYAYLFILYLAYLFLPSTTCVIYPCFKLCVLGESYGRIACFKFIYLSKPTWLKMVI